MRIPQVDLPAPVVVASNRGPISFSRDDDGNLVPKRGAGGLVSALSPVARGTGATWMACAISDEDREAAGQGVIEEEGYRVRSLVIDPQTYRMSYDVVSNATLWFLHHNLFDLSRRPRLDRRWRQAWDAYREVNHTFARTIIDEAPEDAIVLVQDYHLAMVGAWLAQERQDLRAVHFSHTPFCEPSAIRVLPHDVAEELLSAMSSHTSCGFHSRRWAANFEACCDEVLGWKASTFVSPLSPDAGELRSVAESDDCARELDWLDDKLGDRRMILRVDRIELSKNLLRGFLAFEELLQTHEEWRGRVIFVAMIYPSRESLPEYLAYRREVEVLAEQINERWARPGWEPVLVDSSDNFPRSVAAYSRFDVLLVNPVRDGLNLVAKEGVLLNRNDGAVVLSREAGAWEELGHAALAVNPFDVSGTAETLVAALEMSREERAEHAAALREAVEARNPQTWLEDQLKQATG